MAIRVQRTALVGGDILEAEAFAAEISKYVTETLGLPTAWGMQVGGATPTLHWFSDHANMTELEAALLKIVSDAGYHEVLAKAKDLFVEGRSEDTLIYMM